MHCWTLDSGYWIQSQTLKATIIKLANYHLTNILKMKELVGQLGLEKLVYVFFLSWLRCCYVLFTGVSETLIRKLQLTPKAAQ